MMECWKVKYRSKERAEKALKTIKKKYFVTPYVNIYQCPDCRKWHIGHNRYIKEKLFFGGK